MIHWSHLGQEHSAQWRSESIATAPARVQVVDDTLRADDAYRLACQGTGLLWQGDFQNARLLLQALARRVDAHRSTGPNGKAGPNAKGRGKPTRRVSAKTAAALAAPAANTKTAAVSDAIDTPAAAFYRHRQAQAQRARVLSSLLIPLDAQYSIPLRRAPDWQAACAQAWGAPAANAGQGSVAPLRELLGIVGAFEWRKKGIEIPALGAPPRNRIHPHYGVFSPVRGEYIDLIAQTPLPAAALAPGACAFDIGTGTGVLAAVLARRGVPQVLATELDPRAVACAQANLQALGCAAQVQVQQIDTFPPGRAALVVCNPPWLPGKPSAPIENAVYDPDSRMLRSFVAGLAQYLAPGGEGWLVLSDLAEHLGLRTRAQLQEWIAQAGLQVLARHDVRPRHPKATDPTDPLHAARAAEVTSLWRLAVVG